MNTRRRTIAMRRLSSPPASSEAVANAMRGNVSKNTGPELSLRKALRRVGVSGYRSNWKGVPGSPDIVFPKHRIAIFVHGCFWHRHFHDRGRLPKKHTKYWREKFRRNMERDKRKVRLLRKLGWKVIIIWECQLQKDPLRYANKIDQLIHSMGDG